MATRGPYGSRVGKSTTSDERCESAWKSFPEIYNSFGKAAEASPLTIVKVLTPNNFHGARELMRTNYTAVLPGFLRPLQIPELVRLGRNFDGGYLADRRCIEDAECLVSIGINDDWSFEKDFRTRSQVPIIAIDARTSKWLFRRRQYRETIKSFLKGLVGQKNRSDPRQHKVLLEDYEEFFRNDNRHIRKFVAGVRDRKHITINDVVNGFMPKHCCRFLLKIDIEGAEYGILDDILGVSSRLDGLVMEFHDVGERIDEIGVFIAKLPLRLCHVHCNNYGRVDDRGLPEAIELSFTAREVIGTHVVELPNVLDRRNSPHLPEIRIAFE